MTLAPTARFLVCVVITLLSLPKAHALTFNTAYVKNGAALELTECSTNTLIDLTFSSSSSLSCSASSCTVTNPSQNQIMYLDPQGNYVAYSLISAQFVQETFVTGFSFGFTFKFVDASGTRVLYLSIPITSSSPPTSNIEETIFLSSSTDAALNTLKQLSDASLSNGIPLSGFNFLTALDYKQFYMVMDAAKTTSWLVSRVLYKISYTPLNFATSSIISSFTPDYTTSNVVCWSSLVGGPFQTHMRECYTLWFIIFMVILMWIFILCSNENTKEVYEVSFQNNKWTCWALYSLFHLAHEEFFTRLSRTALIMITLSWQIMVTCAIYSRVYQTASNAVIIWAAIVGWAASIPLPYFLGGCFLKRIYENQIEQFQMSIDCKKIDPAEKKQKEQSEKAIIEKLEHIDSLYYFYYTIILALFTVFSILSVHVMQPLTLELYYRQKQWLATMGIVICWDYFILDPILTFFFGETNWFRIKGFFYNSKLGALHRQVDE